MPGEVHALGQTIVDHGHARDAHRSSTARDGHGDGRGLPPVAVHALDEQGAGPRAAAEPRHDRVARIVEGEIDAPDRRVAVQLAGRRERGARVARERDGDARTRVRDPIPHRLSGAG